MIISFITSGGPSCGNVTQSLETLGGNKSVETSNGPIGWEEKGWAAFFHPDFVFRVVSFRMVGKIKQKNLQNCVFLLQVLSQGYFFSFSWFFIVVSLCLMGFHGFS